jgi:hypothetical protein
VLLPRLLAFLAALTTIVAPVGAHAQETTGPDPATLRAIEAQVSQLRGLQPLAPVELRVLDEASLQHYLVDTFNRDYLPSERESDQKSLVAFGLLAPTDDLVQLELNLYQQQIVGLYDPDDRLMYVVNGGTFGPADKVTYAHEFDHALQDQYFSLNAVAPKHPLSNDRSLAAHAVIEGDAVMLQSQWTAADLTNEDKQQLAQGMAGGDGGLSNVPPVLRTELLFPYLDGLRFVREAYRLAHNDYSAIDALLKDPPTSTAEILHPERYFDGWRPVDVALPSLVSVLGDDWRQVGSGVFGELDLRTMLAQYGDRQTAESVAAGWSGDRWQLVEKDGQDTMVLKTHWSSDNAAGAFFDAYRRGLQSRFAGAVVEEDSAARQALTTAGWATDVRLSGSDVVAVIGPDAQTVGTVIAALQPSVP